MPYVTPDSTDPRLQALVTYGRRGGIARGETAIYSPASFGKIRPATFEIRWNPKSRLKATSLLIRELSPSGVEILRENVDGQSGRIISKNARQSLAKYRVERGHGPLLLIILNAREEMDRVTFFLVSVTDEEALRKELLSWDQEPEGLWRHLGRAHAFMVRDMFTEAAAEYDAALAYAPEGVDLIKRTIAAHERTGNVAREKQLSKRLPKG